MHSALLLRSALIAILPLLSRARPEVGIAPANTSASSSTIAPPLPSYTSSSSTASINDLLTQLVNAEQQALIATYRLAALEEKALATRNAALAAKLKQAQDAAVAEHDALAQAQALAKSEAVAKAEFEAQQKPRQVRRQVLPERAPTCKLLSGDKSRVIALNKAFTYDAIQKGSKDSAGALINSAIEVYTTVKADSVTAAKALFPQNQFYQCSPGGGHFEKPPDPTELCTELKQAHLQAELALRNLAALAVDNRNRKSAFAELFKGPAILDFAKFAQVGNAGKNIPLGLERFGFQYLCGKGF